MKHLLECIFRLCLAISLSVAAPMAMQARGHKPGYGIRVGSTPGKADDSTSILLDDGDPIPTDGKDIRIEMDIWAYPDNPLGSICKVLADNDSNIDLMYCVRDDYRRSPMLVVGDSDLVQDAPLQYGEWVHVSLSMSPSTGEVTLDYDGTVSKTSYSAFKGAKSIRVAAGFCKLSDYLLFDVASVAIKDVDVFRGDKKIRSWKMERHNGNVCYDEVAHAPATVENANWLIDENASWKKIYSAEFPFFPSIAFDPRVATFYMAYKGDDKLYVFHANENATDTISIKGGHYVASYPNQLIYVSDYRNTSECRQLLAYNLDENLFSFFDPARQSWSSEKGSSAEHRYWNNTNVYNPADSSIVSFGGYGFYHYNNILLRSYPDGGGKEQKKVELTEIHPRYACSSVLVDSTLYIFGGRGCQSGRQELGPRNYYDMYAVALRTDKVTKLWGDNESPAGKGHDFVPGENMVYDREHDCMYIFGTHNGGILFRADMKTGAFEEMSFPIHASLHAQTLYCNLYYSKEQKSFYAVMVNSDTEGASTVNIYQLDYPPVPISSLSQEESASGGSGGMKVVVIAACVCACFAAAAVYMIRRRRRLRSGGVISGTVDNEGQAPEPEPKTEPESSSAPSAQSVEPATAGETKAGSEATKIYPAEEKPPVTRFYDLEKSSVRFLGGFRVFDKEGKDITFVFTPTLKKLLIILVLYTGKNPMGIPNSKLLSLLWNDKEEEAAKNNRNVYMSRLRNLLTQIGDVSIEAHNGFRNIAFGPGATCDYLEAQRLFDCSDAESLDRLLELLFNGMVLPNVEIDYVDPFKSSFSNRTLDLLSALIRRPDLSSELKLKIADTLFQHDFINEDALLVKCRILHEQGRTGLAQASYNSFCKEYRQIIGSDYPHTLTDILNNTISEQ